jgi:YggT family protein
VNALLCQLLFVISQLLRIYLLLMLVYAVVSWVPSLRGRWSDYLAMIIEPVLMPFRRVIPPLGGLDVSFLVVMLLLGYLSRFIVPTACYYGLY